MAVHQAKRLINVDEYYRMAEVGILTEHDQVELIHGEIIKMSPIGSKHMAIVNRLNKLLHEQLSGEVIVSIQNPVKINDLNVPEPDITLLKYREDYYAEKHPEPKDILLVIEVSDTTFAFDKEIKLPLYASAGIPEFWLINIEKKEIEVHKMPADDVYKNITLHRKGDTISWPYSKDVNLDAGMLLGI
jgi:Uma2 family endonuclease